MHLREIDDAVLAGLGRLAIESRRGSREVLDTAKPFALVREQEPAGKSRGADVATVFLTGAECPYRCSMCDLWQYTLDRATMPGEITRQLSWVLDQLDSQVEARPEWIKLYNASNFFDSRAVPEDDHSTIAKQCESFQRVIVENHPKLVRPTVKQFASLLRGRLEIAMGLETVHPGSMLLLNKGFDLDDFARASEQLDAMQIDRRAFVMLQPPGTEPSESMEWAMKTLTFADAHGVRHCSIIPTRMGNGTMEWLQEQSLFIPPTFRQLEQTLELALDHFSEMVVTVDTWNLELLAGTCDRCIFERKERIERMNLQQCCLPEVKRLCDCAQG
jgi:radical SAM enzyme (TIGR01210 family)